MDHALKMENMMAASFISRNRQSEAGNVLFLILLAVILFAALSYAVTQSSRTGGGDASSESNLIRSSEITQYPAAVKTAMVRMVVNGKTYEELKFNPPADFAGLTDTTDGVFHPAGGSAVYQTASPDIMDDGLPGTWYFNPNFEIENIATTAATAAGGNEFIAFLPGIKTSICRKINEEVGIGTTIPATSGVASTDVDELYDDADSETIPAETAILGSAAAFGTALSGQPAGCFTASDTVNVYYQVLAER